jgi:hypothetical protein
VNIPKNLETSIRKCAQYYKIANEETEKIRKWFFDNKYDTALNDMLIDSCHMTDNADSFINFLNGAEDENGYTIEDFKGNDSIESIDDYY